VRDITLSNITEAVITHADPKVADPRLLEIYTSFIRHMHDFVRDVRLTEPELMQARAFFTALGRPHQQMPDGEVHMFTDLIGVSELVELLHDPGRGLATETNLEGPLYVAGAPHLANGACIGIDPKGETLFMSGQVRSLDGRPLAGATVDVWQPNSQGFYDMQDAAQPKMNFRGVFTTDARGRYDFETVIPLGYNVPSSGPSGAVLRALGRHTWRPAHIHVKLGADGHLPVTTMVYVEGAKWIESDTTFSVKQALINCVRHDTAAELAARGRDQAFYTAAFDFVLTPADARARAA
jgi:catechol 1,2-dioxygenase/hydroxyquinol 1,2-dioxygenase